MGIHSPTGSVVGGFRVGELLAAARWAPSTSPRTTDGRRVALKLLSPELAHDERFRRRFLRESRLAATLDHPNVVRTLASGEDDGVLYLAMAYVDGVDLRELLRREGRLDARARGRLVRAGRRRARRRACGRARPPRREARQHPRRAGPDGEHAYVCDFGLARHVSSVGSLTGDRGFVGTVDYVAPEQIHGERDRRPRRRLLARLRALRVPRRRAAVRARQRAGGRLRAPERAAAAAHRACSPDLPAARDAVFARALAKEPADRYADLRALVAAARRCAARPAACAAAGRAVGSSPRAARRARGSRARDRHGARASATTRRRRAGGGAAARARAPSTPSTGGRSRAFARARGRLRPRHRWTSSSPAARPGCCCRRATPAARRPAHARGRTAACGCRGRRSGGSRQATATSGRRRTDGPGARAHLDARTGRLRALPPGGLAGDGARGRRRLALARDRRRRRRVDPGNGTRRAPLPVPRQRQRSPSATARSGRSRVTGTLARSTRRQAAMLATDRRCTASSATSPSAAARLGLGRPGRRRLPARRGRPAACGAGSRPARIRSASRSAAGGSGSRTAPREPVTSLDPRSGARARLTIGAMPYGGGLPRRRRLDRHRAGAAAAAAGRGPELRLRSRRRTSTLDPAVPHSTADEQLADATCANLLTYPDTPARRGSGSGPRSRPRCRASPTTAAPTRSASAPASASRRRRTSRSRRPRSGTRSNAPSRRSSAAAARPERCAGDRRRSPPSAPARRAHLGHRGARRHALDHARAARGRLPCSDLAAALLPGSARRPIRPTWPASRSPSPGPYYVSSARRRAGRAAERIRTTAAPATHRRADRLHARPPDAAGGRTRRSRRARLPAARLRQRLAALAPAARSTVATARAAPRRAGQQRYFPTTARFIDYSCFNTKRPLFRDVSLRRAVNYALDRPALATAVPRHRRATRSSRRRPTASRQARSTRSTGPTLRPRGGSPATAPARRSPYCTFFPFGDDGLAAVAPIVKADLARIGIDVSIVRTRRSARGATTRARTAADLLLVTNFGSTRSATRSRSSIGRSTRGRYASALGPGPWNSAVVPPSLRCGRARCAGRRARGLRAPRAGADARGAVRRLRHVLVRAVRLAADRLPAATGRIRRCSTSSRSARAGLTVSRASR